MIGYTLSDSKRNKGDRKELHITEFMEQCRRNRKEHVEMANSDRIPKRIFKYQLEDKED
jgi:hypothetical protein